MNKEVFVNNRKRVLALMEDDSILVSISRRPALGDVEEKFNVNRNYYYLSGVMEFDNVVVLVKKNGNESEMIFINPYDEFRAKWHGASLSKEKVISLSGINDVRYLPSFDQMLFSFANNTKNIYLDMVPNSLYSIKNEDEALAEQIKLKCPWVNILNARSLFMKTRMIKCDEEIEEMRKAILITKKGIEAILENIGPMYEYQLESYFDQKIKFEGANGYAFPTIAASGENGCCLHYSFNNSMAKDGDLILFDLGASVNMYCADISRTFPINGKFTPRQKEIYNIVLNAQQEVFKAAKPGVTTRDLNQVVIKYYQQELKRIGLIKEDSEVSKYYYHGVSHHIGLDVHDLSEFKPLEAGNVISNEPGLYIAEEGIGIRIEDDILITEDGAKWLSPEIIKTVDEIEDFIAKNKK